MAYKGRTKLGDFFSSRRDKGLPGLPTLSVTLNRGLVERDSLDRKTETNLEDNEHLLVRKGDIPYNMMRMWQGASGLAEKDGLLSPAYVVLAPKRDVDSLYASYLFKSSRLIYLFWAYSYGLTNDRLRLYFNDFKKIPVDIPSLPEQKKIACILSTWDKAIELTEQLLSNNRRQKKSLMQQLLTGKKRLPGFSEEWKEVVIGSFGKIVTGSTPPKSEAENYGDKFSWATAEDFNKKYVCDTVVKLSDIGASKARRVPKGSVLVTCIASIGKNAIAGEELATNQQINAIVVGPNYSNEFVYYLIDHYNKKLLAWTGITAVPIINKSIFEKVKFTVPPRKEQKEIASVLSSSDQELETLQQKLNCLKQQKKALMQQLLTGKRRVKVDEP